MLPIASEYISRAIWLAIALCVAYPILTIGYNLMFHPLSRFPGPILWRSTRLAYMYSMWNGRYHIDSLRLHAKYGSVVRVAPNELSFADTAAWEDIHSNRGGSSAFPKTAIWHAAQAGRANAIINTLDRDEHAKMRKKMEPGFTERAVAGQEGIVQTYVNLFIHRIRERAIASKNKGLQGTILDISSWYTFVSLDVVGNLAFGEDFGCLQRSQMNDWMALLFGSIKAQVLFATLRYYPWLTWLLECLIAGTVKEKSDYHWRIVEEKVNKRTRREIKAPDFIKLWQKDSKGREGLNMGEVYANAFIMTFAGSETVATSLAGTTSWLVKSPEKLAILASEVRTRFQREEEMSFATLKELPYLHAALWEGLRMCNPFPVGSLRMVPPDGGFICGLHIPRNTFVSVNHTALSFDSTRFHDASSFCPERWLPEAASDPYNVFFNDDRSAIQPFSVGPRGCIGKPLALCEMKMILARLVWAFDIQRADTPAGWLVWKDQKTYTLVEKQPFEIKLVERID